MKDKMDVNSLCMGCMSDLEDKNLPCSKCGFDLKNYIPETYMLKPFTILKGMYLVGRAMEETCYRITYIGWDIANERKVVMREYFPVTLAQREPNAEIESTKVSCLIGKADFYHSGLRRFIQHAENLSSLGSQESILQVKDFFEENATAYIVMEYIDFITLNQYIENNGGKLNANEVLNLMRSIISSLSYIHAKGIMHTDITPYNIYLTNYGELKLDNFNLGIELGLPFLFKPGYTAPEQYTRKGEKGPWTDVYGLCTVIYKMITGVTPQESIDRKCFEDNLVAPSTMGIALPLHIEKALLKGLAVNQKDRYQNMDALYEDIYGNIQGGNELSGYPFSADANNCIYYGPNYITEVKEPEKQSARDCVEKRLWWKIWKR